MDKVDYTAIAKRCLVLGWLFLFATVALKLFGFSAFGIIGTTLGGMAVAGMANNGGCGCNNGGGILGNIFGNGNHECYETKESAALREQIAALVGERYADHVGLELYQEQVASDKEIIAYVNAGFTEIAAKMAANDKTSFEAIAALDKQAALNKQAGEYQFVITDNKIDCVTGTLNSSLTHILTHLFVFVCVCL